MKKIISIGLGMIQGAYLLFLWFLWEEKTAAAFFIFIIFLTMGFVSSIFLGSLIHELGHLIFGLIFGMNFRFFEVFGFRFDQSGFSFRSIRKENQGMLGRVSMTAHKLTKRRDLLFFFLGGIFMNFLLAILLLFFHFPLKSYSQLLFIGCGLGNFNLAVMNLMRFPQKNIYTDGHIVRLLYDQESGFYETILLQNEIMDGKAPKDLVDIELTAKDPLVQVEQAELFFLQKMDRKEYDRIEEMLPILRPWDSELFNIDDVDRLSYIVIYYAMTGKGKEDAMKALDFRKQKLQRSKYSIALLARYLMGFPVAKYQIFVTLKREKNLGMQTWCMKLLQEFEKGKNEEELEKGRKYVF